MCPISTRTPYPRPFTSTRYSGTLDSLSCILTKAFIDTVVWNQVIKLAGLWFLDSRGGVSLARRRMWHPLGKFYDSKFRKSLFDMALMESRSPDEFGEPEQLREDLHLSHTLNTAIQSFFFHVLPALIELGAGIGLTFWVDFYIGLIYLTVISLMVFTSTMIHCRISGNQTRFLETLSHERLFMRTSMKSWKLSLFPGRFKNERAEFHSIIDDQWDSCSSLLLWFKVESVMHSCLLASGLVGCCLWALYQFNIHRMSTGMLVMLIFVWFRVPSQLQFLPTAVRTFVTSFRSTHCLIGNLNQAPGFQDEVDAKTLVVDQGIVEFKDVSFGHCGLKELLSGLDFKVHSGQTVALVGESGSGKSSTLKLLLRIYDSTYGKILIDGQDIQQVTVESLRANIGVAPQEEIWFHDTIMDNVKYANNSIQNEEIYKACSAVGLHGLISSLKNGYKTIMGEGGVRLSTGELQRLAIARVIVNAGKIAILDEPTSNVDSRTESRILRNIKSLFPGRTVLIIS